MDLAQFQEEMNLPDFRELTSAALKDVPDLPGAYVIATLNGQELVYPNANSRIFYIGESDSLLRRMKDHLRYSNEAKTAAKPWEYYSRYSFAGKFGALFTFIPCAENESSERLEGKLLSCFAHHCHTFPVANSSIPWRHIS